MSASSVEHTHQLLQSLELTEEDLQVNKQGRLSERQFSRLQKESKQFRVAGFVAIALLVVFYSVTVFSERNFLASQMMELIIFSLVIVAGIVLCVWGIYETFKIIRELPFAQVAVQEGEAVLEVHAGYNRSGRDMYARFILNGKQVGLPRQTVLLLVRGLRYRIYTYKDAAIAIEALEGATSEQLQATSLEYQQKHSAHTRYVLMLFGLMAIPVVLTFILKFISYVTR